MFADDIAFTCFIWCWARPVCDSWVSSCQIQRKCSVLNTADHDDTDREIRSCRRLNRTHRDR